MGSGCGGECVLLIGYGDGLHEGDGFCEPGFVLEFSACGCLMMVDAVACAEHGDVGKGLGIRGEITCFTPCVNSGEVATDDGLAGCEVLFEFKWLHGAGDGCVDVGHDQDVGGVCEVGEVLVGDVAGHGETGDGEAGGAFAHEFLELGIVFGFGACKDELAPCPASSA